MLIQVENRNVPKKADAFCRGVSGQGLTSGLRQEWHDLLRAWRYLDVHWDVPQCWEVTMVTDTSHSQTAGLQSDPALLSTENQLCYSVLQAPTLESTKPKALSSPLHILPPSPIAHYPPPRSLPC